MKLCECGHDLPDNAKFCDDCGRPQPPVVHNVTTLPVSLHKPPAAPAPRRRDPAPERPPAPTESPSLGPTPSPPARPRDNGQRKVVVIVLTLVALALAGVGGSELWKNWREDVNRRSCPVQPADITAVTGWQATPTFAAPGSDPYPEWSCGYRQTGGYFAKSAEEVTVRTGSSEAGVTPAEPRHCLKGGYWGGRGYACQDATDVEGDVIQMKTTSVSLSGVRLNGADSYAVDVVCVELVAPELGVRQELRERCLKTLTALMDVVGQKANVLPDAGVQQEPLNVDLLAAAVRVVELESRTGQSADPPSTPTVGAPSDAPTGAPTVAGTNLANGATPTLDEPSERPVPAQDAKTTLDQLAEAGASNLAMDGHWAVQLASKRDGITDKTQTTTTGSHTFRYADILEEHQRLKATFSDVYVALIHGSAISSKASNRALYVTIADPGDLTTRAAVLRWCQEHFPGLGKDARLNVCYPRKLQLD